MAQDIQPANARPVTAAPFFAPPTARELRGQAVHRLQVGLFGLCAMLLLVGLANIIMDRARMSDGARQAKAGASDSADGVTSDPLADIGVAPAPAPETKK